MYQTIMMYCSNGYRFGMSATRLSYFELILVFCLFTLPKITKAQQTELQTYPFYGTAGVSQLITTNFSTPKSATASGIQVTLGTGPWYRFFAEGQISAHRLLGVGENVKRGYLMSYAWRVGILPYKPLPFIIYGGAGYHTYHIAYNPLVIQNVQILPGVEYRRITDYWSIGVSYPIFRCFEADVSFRKEPFLNNELAINAHYISLGINAWLFKFDRFPHPKKAMSEK
jgi:hypothetical protein